MNAHFVGVRPLIAVLYLAAAAPHAHAQVRSSLAGRSPGLAPTAELVDLFVPLDVESPFTIDVPLEGERVTLRLEKHSVRSARFEVVVNRGGGAVETIEPGPISTFEGRSEARKDLVVAGGIADTGLEATVIALDGRAWRIEPAASSATTEGLATYVVRRDDGVAPDDTGSGNAGDSDGSSGSYGFGEAGCGGDFCLAELACDTDYEFLQSFGGSSGAALARIECLVNVANAVFERDVDLSHRLTTVILRTSAADPYESTTGSGIRDELSNEWTVHQTSVPRDLVLMFTGKGASFEATRALCDPSNEYLVVSHRRVIGDAWASMPLVHTLGVAWGATTCSCPGTVMSRVDRSGLRFDPTAIAAITAFRDSLPCLQPSVTNDDRRRAILICAGAYSGDTRNATSDGAVACNEGGAPDVWYRFQPTQDGVLTVDTCGSTLNTVLVAEDANGVPIACNDDAPSGPCGPSPQSMLQVPVTAGAATFIRVTGASGAAGPYTLHVVGPACASPPNTTCATAIDVCPGSYVGTLEGIDPLRNRARVVWYRYRPAVPGVIALDLCDATFDGRLYVFDSCPINPMRPITIGLQRCGTGGSYGSFVGDPSVTYSIGVVGLQDARGPFTLRVTGPSCASDLCSSAVAVGAGTYAGDFQGTTSDGVSSCESPSPDVWYRFTATENLRLTVDTCGTHPTGDWNPDRDTILSLHSGCPGTGANELTCNDDAPAPDCHPHDAQVSTRVATDETVYIRVTTVPNAIPGPYVLNVATSPVVSNDRCEDATTIGVGTFVGDTDGANPDDGACNELAFVWYRFVAPSAGGVLGIDTYGSFSTYSVQTCLVARSSACDARGDLTCVYPTANHPHEVAWTTWLAPDAEFWFGVCAVPFASSSHSFVLNVSFDENDPPSAPLLVHPDHAYEGISWTITATSTDADGDALTYSLFVNSNANSSAATTPYPSGAPVEFTHPIIGDGRFTIRVVATDSHGANGAESQFTIDVADVDCRTGNVNQSTGRRANVLRVNRSSGATAARTFDVLPSEPIEVSLSRPPAGPTSPQYAVWMWRQRPTSATRVNLPAMLGPMAMNPLLHACQSSCPTYGAMTLPLPTSQVLGSTAEATQSPVPGVVMSLAAGRFAAGEVLWVQGLVEDASSPFSRHWSVTNGVEIRVVDSR